VAEFKIFRNTNRVEIRDEAELNLTRVVRQQWVKRMWRTRCWSNRAQTAKKKRKRGVCVRPRKGKGKLSLRRGATRGLGTDLGGLEGPVCTETGAFPVVLNGEMNHAANRTAIGTVRKWGWGPVGSAEDRSSSGSGLGVWTSAPIKKRNVPRKDLSRPTLWSTEHCYQ